MIEAEARKRYEAGSPVIPWDQLSINQRRLWGVLMDRNDREAKQSGIGCPVCGHISCVCRIREQHEDGCQFRRSATCAVPIECEHGRDVCPICDPCTCTKSKGTP